MNFEQIWALRVEAEESRHLADRSIDRQTVIDLEGYASNLEAQAAQLQSEQEFSLFAYAGHA
jgi:hypothetical protein